MSLIILLTYLGSHSVLAAPTKIPIPVNSFDLRLSSGDIPPYCSTACDQRSILEIAWGCMTTLFACSWVAVHPNVPPPDSKWYKAALTRMELMIWTILAPECIIYWAARQRLGAKKLKKMYSKKGWTMKHGHFVQMGGFILDDGAGTKEVVSPNRLEELDTQNLIVFPKVSEEEIEDRSKADWLAKLVALVQVAWFIAQYTARVAQSLATTQLELITLAFAALNGIMYIYWWYKPFDVRSPILIHKWCPTMVHDWNCTVASCAHSNAFRSELPEEAGDGTPLVGSTNPCSVQREVNQHIAKKFTPFASTMEAEIRERLQLFCGYEDNPSKAKTALPIFFSSQISDEKHVLLSILIAVLGVIFGGIHCIGWKFLFPSVVEEHLWQISSLIVLAFPAAQLILMLPAFISTKYYKSNLGKRIQDIADDVWTDGSTLFLWLIPVYIIARLFIIVEAFVALRDIPPSATAVVEWAKFIHHK